VGSRTPFEKEWCGEDAIPAAHAAAAACATRHMLRQDPALLHSATSTAALL
jgi:hypothetical protein